MQRREFVGLLGAMPAGLLAALEGHARPAEVQELAFDPDMVSVRPFAHLQQLLDKAWVRVTKGSTHALPIRWPVNAQGTPMPFDPPGLALMPDVSKCKPGCRSHHQLYMCGRSLGKSTSLTHVLQLDRMVTTPRTIDVDELRTRPHLLEGCAWWMALELVCFMRDRVAKQSGVTKCNTGLTMPVAREILAEWPHVWVEKKAYMLRMFAYTMYGLPTTLEQLAADYPLEGADVHATR